MRAMQLKGTLLGFGAFVVLLSTFTACNRKTVPTDEVIEEVGNDRDEHDCIGSAGYIWSALLKKCIRPWEEGIQMEDAQHVGATTVAVLVSNKEGDQKEVFLPFSKMGIILTQEDMVWEDEDGSYKLQEPISGQFELYDSEGVLLYKSISK